MSRRNVKLMWFDPGGTTGWAVAVVDARWLTGELAASWAGLKAATVSLSVGQAGTGYGGAGLDVAELDMIAECAEIMAGYPDAAWGYEDFIPGQFNQGREFLTPVRVFSALAAIEYVQQEHDVRTPFVQNAALAKTTATDPRLKVCGWYRPGLPHGTDAARHCATFLRRARDDVALRELAWPETFA